MSNVEVEVENIKQLDWAIDFNCEHSQHATDLTHHAKGGDALYRMTCYGGHSFVASRCAKFVNAVKACGAICFQCESWYGIDGFEKLDVKP